MNTYHVSGIIQFTIRARTAKEAVQRAEKQADRMTQGRVIINLDNWDCDETCVMGADLTNTNEDVRK